MWFIRKKGHCQDWRLLEDFKQIHSISRIAFFLKEVRERERETERSRERTGRIQSIDNPSFPFPFHSTEEEKRRASFFSVCMSLHLSALWFSSIHSHSDSHSLIHMPLGGLRLSFTSSLSHIKPEVKPVETQNMHACMYVWMNGWIEGSRNEMKQKWLTVYCRHTHFAIWIDDVQKQGRGTRQRRIWSGRRELMRAWQSDNDRFFAAYQQFRNKFPLFPSNALHKNARRILCKEYLWKRKGDQETIMRLRDEWDERASIESTTMMPFP